MKTRLFLTHLPPSVNHAYARTRNGVRKSDAYMAWSNGEGYRLNRMMAGQHRFTGLVYVTMAMRRPVSNADLDNRIKPTGDILQAIGAIDNDRNIMGWNVWWTNDLPPGTAAEIVIVAADAEVAA